MQSLLNVLACPMRLLAASVNPLTIVLVVIGKKCKKTKQNKKPFLLPFTVVCMYCILVYTWKTENIFTCAFENITPIFSLPLKFLLLGNWKFRVKIVISLKHLFGSLQTHL